MDLTLTFFAIVLVAAGVSIAVNAMLRPLLARYAAAIPNARSSHKTPTPQGGGIAVVVAVLVAVVAAAIFSLLDPATLMPLWPLAAAVVLLAVTGALDDAFHLPIMPRLSLQIVAVGAALAALPHETRVLTLLPWSVERAALLVIGVYVVNIVNFMDGIDLMTVAEVVPVTAALSALAAAPALAPSEWAIAVALLGSMIGFAPFNRPVAKLFLGDVGSLPIGLLLFWLLLQLVANGHIVAALLLPLYYLADASLTLLRRFARGENVLQAHRGHFYQQATDRALSVTEVVTRVFVVNVALAALALMTVIAPSGWVQALGLALGAAAVGLLLASFVRGKPRGIR